LGAHPAPPHGEEGEKMKRAVVLLGLLASACGMDGAERNCIPPPCPIPLAITVDVTSSAGGAVAGTVLRLTGRATGTAPCETGASTTTCRVPGDPGTYDLELSAPGFETARRSVTVSGTTPDCGCTTIVPVHLDVVLAPTS
jgi:hypothetical protein